jgi:hypothetical protein
MKYAQSRAGKRKRIGKEEKKGRKNRIQEIENEDMCRGQKQRRAACVAYGLTVSVRIVLYLEVQ